MKHSPRPRTIFLAFCLSVFIAVLLCSMMIGCSSSQVDQSIDAANHLIAATKQPVVDDFGALPVIGPYIRTGSRVIADLAYELVQVLHAIKPNAGEPIAPPSTAPSP
jgi:hypothetical protein